MPPLEMEGQPIEIVEPLIAPAGQTMELTRLPEVARKTSDQIVSNSTVLVDATELFFPVRNLEVWAFVLFVLQNSSGVADMDIGWALPGTSVMRWSSRQLNGALTESDQSRLSGVAADRTETYEGIVFPDADGDVQLQFAQGTAEVSNTTMLARSYLIATRLD